MRTAVSRHQVTESVGNNLYVHTQGKAYKKSHAPVYQLSVVKKNTKMASRVLRPMIPNLNLVSDQTGV